MDAERLAATWDEYCASREISRRNELVSHYHQFCRQIVVRSTSTIPAEVEREDLFSYGTFGLIDAVEKFDPERGVRFETYAANRIRGSVIDHLRAYDWAPRSVRAVARDLDRVRQALEAELGRAPRDEDVAERLGVSMETLWALQSQASVPSMSPLTLTEGDEEHAPPESFLPDPAANPQDVYDITELSEMLARPVSMMSERSKMVMALYYVEELTLSEIGAMMGVTESRVSQLQSRAIASLHGFLVGHEQVGV